MVVSCTWACIGTEPEFLTACGPELSCTWACIGTEPEFTWTCRSGLGAWLPLLISPLAGVHPWVGSWAKLSAAPLMAAAVVTLATEGRGIQLCGGASGTLLEGRG